LAGIVNAQGYSESNQVFTFGNAPSAEYQNTFIIRCLSGKADENSPTLSTRFYDNQTWDIQIAFEKSSQSDTVNLDEIHRAKETLIKELDDPANWSTSTRLVKYNSWKIEEELSYYLLTITLDVVDTYTY
jgi:hypothetical protein